jgi:hypothetical protein
LSGIRIAAAGERGHGAIKARNDPKFKL